MLNKLERIMIVNYHNDRVGGMTQEEAEKGQADILAHAHLVTDEDDIRTAWDSEPSLKDAIQSVEADIRATPMYNAKTGRMESDTRPRRYY